MPQPPMHSPVDAPLFSINVFTVLISWLGGFNFKASDVLRNAFVKLTFVAFIHGIKGIHVHYGSDITGLT